MFQTYFLQDLGYECPCLCLVLQLNHENVKYHEKKWHVFDGWSFDSFVNVVVSGSISIKKSSTLLGF